ncbi:TetR/AcrR family transcriptional regulator [Listeria weihenstephanensis]|uniref:TetR/AcrR family transcriptional regulator n=1 Tax=Listeria weihenstephanensis TaxID=1006155 RepID=A0A841Z686_9LIST|nr:TetR/AcrR family transcriptional regulator [Listeria weihenstephanensis]MBC1500728.1 TetR/AcrR family transcriptional regulator [Listeria weihenstephanensis]
MSERKEDLRSLRTKTHLSNALLELINEDVYTFEAITINMFCDKAMVHRTTFYKHFEDKYHLLTYCVDKMQTGFDRFTPRERLCQPFMCMFEAWDWQLVLTIFECFHASEQFRNDFGKRMNNLMLADLSKLLKDGENTDVPKEIIAEIFGHAISGLALWWVSREQTTPAEEMDGYFQALVNTRIFD